MRNLARTCAVRKMFHVKQCNSGSTEFIVKIKGSLLDCFTWNTLRTRSPAAIEVDADEH